MTVYDIPEIVSEAWKDSMTIRNISSGFEKTGIWPYNDNVFTEADFAPSVATDQPDPLSASVLGNPADDLSTSRTVPPKDQVTVLAHRETSSTTSYNTMLGQTAQQVNVQFQYLTL